MIPQGRDRTANGPDDRAAMVGALAHIGHVQDDLVNARSCAEKAALGLDGTRRERCNELAVMLATTKDVADRLAVVVEGDIRAADCERS